MNKQLWLAEKLQQRDYTREELQAAWADEEENHCDMRRSTFFDNLRALQNNYGFIVENNGGIYHLRIESNIQHIMLQQLTLNGHDTQQTRGLQWVCQLSDAVLRNRLVRMRYCSPCKQPYDTLLAAHSLTTYKDNIYVIGLSSHHANDTMRTFAFDRIAELEVLAKRFARDKKFSQREYFKNSYGIFAGAGVVAEEVILRTTSSREGEYIRKRRLHASQCELEPAPDGFPRFSLNVGITEDFIQELLSRAGYVVWEQPEALRCILRERAAALLEGLRCE